MVAEQAPGDPVGLGQDALRFRKDVQLVQNGY